MYNAWRQQTADVSVIHNYIDIEKWLEFNFDSISLVIGKLKVKGVGWAGKAQMANALSLFQSHQNSEKKCKAHIFYTATYKQLKKYFRLSQCFILWLDGSAYDLPLPCDSPPSLIKVPE